MGVWIETTATGPRLTPATVTPYVGVWIETFEEAKKMNFTESLLMWECGLKH